MDHETLAGFLRTARERCSLSLRAVEQQTDVSNAYLSQLEHGRIRQPSPVILYKLSELYRVSYAKAMHLAGYPIPALPAPDPPAVGVARFRDVTPDEEEALAEYLEFLRTRQGRSLSRRRVHSASASGAGSSRTASQAPWLQIPTVGRPTSFRSSRA